MTKRIMSWILNGLHVNQSSGKHFNVDESDFSYFAEFLDEELMIKDFYICIYIERDIDKDIDIDIDI